MVAMVRRPCGEGTSLEYNRSLGSGCTSNRREKERVKEKNSKAEGVMGRASVFRLHLHLHFLGERAHKILH